MSEPNWGLDGTRSLHAQAGAHPIYVTETRLVKSGAIVNEVLPPGLVRAGTNIIITPVYRRGADSGFDDTRRLIGTMQTRIEGITSQPILLTNFYSQTISFGHGSFGIEFLFEPRLEQGISQHLLDELEALDIRLFHLAVNASRSLHFIGRNGTWRRVGSPALQ